MRGERGWGVGFGGGKRSRGGGGREDDAERKAQHVRFPNVQSMLGCGFESRLGLGGLGFSICPFLESFVGVISGDPLSYSLLDRSKGSVNKKTPKNI